MRINKGEIGEKITSFTFPNEPTSCSYTISMHGFSYCSSDFQIKRQSSPFSVVGFVTSGHGLLEMDNIKQLLSKNDLFILSKNMPHFYHTKPDCKWEFYWFNISGDFFIDLLTSLNLINQPVYSAPQLEPLFKESLFSTLTANTTFEEKQIKVVLSLFEILTRLSYIHQHSNALSPAALAIKRFIDHHIYDRLTLTTISKALSIPIHQVNHAFKNSFNDTPYNYILNKKISMAKNMLLHTTLSIKQIALSLSFTDPYYFSGVFKEKVSISPSVFRKYQSK